MTPEIAPQARAAPEARPAERQQHQQKMTKIDAVKFAELAVVDRPAGRQIGRCRVAHGLRRFAHGFRRFAHGRGCDSVAVACTIGSTTAWLNSQASAWTMPRSRRITRDRASTSACWAPRIFVTFKCVISASTPAAARNDR